MTFLYKSYDVDYEYTSLSHPNTLLLLHGWGGNKDSFISVKKVLKHNYNIFAISMPPYNNSTLALDMYDYMKIVLNILKLHNINSISIICHSFGMRVSLMLATKITINKIVITGGAGIKFKPNFFKILTTRFRSIFLNQHPEYFTSIASADYVNLSCVDKLTFKNIVNKDLTNYITLLKCPALLFWGNRDTATPIKMLKKFKSLHLNTKCEIIKGGTHFCYLEHAQQFIECCENFLNS